MRPIVKFLKAAWILLQDPRQVGKPDKKRFYGG
jgi:hypothetical protein